MNVPLPFPRRIVTLFDPWFTTTRSFLASPLYLPIAIERGPAPTAIGEPSGLNPPAPLPARIEIELDPKFATARSNLPSPSRSPAAASSGWAPTATGDPEAGANPLPAPPFPRRIVTLFEP
jgi:hypothetical protein